MSDMIEQWMSHADRLVKAGRLDEAAEAYFRLLEKDPLALPVRQALIKVKLQQSDYAEVIHQYMDCAEIHAMRQERARQIELYETVLRMEDTTAASDVGGLVAQVKPEIYFQIGGYHLESGEVDLALQYLEKSRKLAAGRWETHLALARAYMARESFKEAIGELQEVLRLEPEQSAIAYELLGEVFARQKRPLHAVVVWFQNAADLYAKRGALEDAGRIHQRILQIDPNHQPSLSFIRESPSQSEPPEVALAEARELFLAGRLHDATHRLAACLEMHPAHVELQFRLGEVYALMGEADRAAAAFREVLRLDPVVFAAAAYESLGDLLGPGEREGSLQRAVQAYEALGDQEGVKRCRRRLLQA